MIDSLSLYYLEGKFIIGVLILVRISGLITAGPFFKSSAIIPQVKIFLTILLGVIVTSAFWQDQPEIDLHLWNVVFLVIKEFLVGLMLGFAANMLFNAARFAGGIIDMEMGFHTAALFDRDSTTPTLVGEFKEIFVLMLFLVLNGHHYLIEGIYLSMKALPLNTFVMTSASVDMLIELALTIFILGVQMASPILVALFLTNLGLALLARVAPQTNVFILSFQLKVFVGILMLIVTVPSFILISKGALSSVQTEFFEMLKTFTQGV